MTIANEYSLKLVKFREEKGQKDEIPDAIHKQNTRIRPTMKLDLDDKITR